MKARLHKSPYAPDTKLNIRSHNPDAISKTLLCSIDNNVFFKYCFQNTYATTK